MNKVQVEIVDAQSLEGEVEAFLYAVVVGAPPAVSTVTPHLTHSPVNLTDLQFRRDKDVFPLDTGFSDSRSDFYNLQDISPSLKPETLRTYRICKGTVQVPIPAFQGVLYRCCDLSWFRPPGA